MLKKGVYPYEYIDDWFKFDDKELPAIDKFHSNLNLNKITEKKTTNMQKTYGTLLTYLTQESIMTYMYKVILHN